MIHTKSFWSNCLVEYDGQSVFYGRSLSKYGGEGV